jgi:hypothetical protein
MVRKLRVELLRGLAVLLRELGLMPFYLTHSKS